MAYSRRQVEDHKTIMNKDLYDNLQDGIDESKKEIETLDSKFSTLNSNFSTLNTNTNNSVNELNEAIIESSQIFLKIVTPNVFSAKVISVQ